jgi:hypothetical protein
MLIVFIGIAGVIGFKAQRKLPVPGLDLVRVPAVLPGVGHEPMEERRAALLDDGRRPRLETPTTEVEGKAGLVGRGERKEASALLHRSILPDQDAFVLLARFPAVWTPARGAEENHTDVTGRGLGHRRQTIGRELVKVLLSLAEHGRDRDQERRVPRERPVD